MALFTRTSTIGSAGGRDYATPALWVAGIPTNLTTNRSNNAGVGSTTATLVLDASASASNSFYNGHTVTWNGERLLITAYVGATKIATVGAVNSGGTATWSGAPNSGDAFVVEDMAIVGEMYADSEFSSSALIDISGFTTDATRTINLQAASGQSWREAAAVVTRYDATKGVAIRSTQNFQAGAVKLGQSNTALRRTQVRSNAATCYGMVFKPNTANATFDDCLLSDTGCNQAHGFNLDVAGGSGIGKIINCLCILNPSTTAPDAFRGSFCANLTFVGNTCVIPSNAAKVGTGNMFGFGAHIYNGHTWTDNAGFGFGTYFSATPTGGTFSNNAADIAIGSGSNNQASKTYANQFVDTTIAGLDLRPKAGANLIGNGIADATNIPVDALNVTRLATPTIGALEYIQVAPILMPPLQPPSRGW